MKKFFKTKLFAVVCGAVLCLPAYSAVTTPAIKLQSSGNNLEVISKLPGGDWEKASVKMDIFDGKSGKYLTGKTQTSDLQDKVIVKFSGSDYNCVTEFTALGEMIYGKMSFTNNSKVDKWIEPGLVAGITFTRAPEIFWDGFGKMRKIGKKPIERKGIKGLALAHIGAKELPFPAAGVFGKKSGFHFGYKVFDDVSYASAIYDPAKKELRFTQRHVVAPGETMNINWFIGNASSEFGGAETAVQQHYNAYPERWEVDQDAPYVWGNGAHYQTWKKKPDIELMRRLKATWDWAYTPYKRAGDIACREGLWDYKMGNPPWITKWQRFGGKRVPMYEISREDYLKLRREEYRKHGKRFGWMFYSNCAGTWCEIGLAKERYPDAISNQDPHANHILKKWSTWHDWEIRVFSMGTTFAKAFQEDIDYLVDDIKVPGFAFDCATGGVSYYGPATKKQLPGRAWDEKGVFIDQSVAVNHMVDYIHSSRPGTVVFSNGQLKGDHVMFERDFVRVEELASMMPLYKWYIGARPSLVYGSGFRFNDVIANWRNMSQDEFKEAICKLGIYEIFNQFKYGLARTYITQYGIPDAVDIFPEFFELMRAGWRASVPVKMEKSLYAPYKAAYGKNENIYLFFGNSGTEKTTGQVSVINDQLTGYSGDKLVFVGKKRRGHTLANRFRGKETRFRATLPSRVPVLYETACAISNAPDKMDLLAQSRKDINKETYTVTIQKSPEFTGAIKIRARRGFDPVLKLNGNVIQPGTPQNLKAGDVITAEYTSKVFALPQKKILDFPYTAKNGKVICKVWYDANDKDAERAAKRFDDFFKFLQDKNVLKKGGKVQFVNAPELRGGAGVITLDSTAKAAKVSLTPAGGLLIAAPGEDALEKTVSSVLDIMDKRYPYFLPFAPCGGMPGEVLKYFKMTGKTLPLNKFFD